MRLIASDLDGTLLRDDKSVSPGNRQAIRDALAAGAEFVVATGRPVYNIGLDLFRSLGCRYVISSNGTAVHRLSDMACLYQEPMESADALELARELSKLPICQRIFVSDAICMQTSQAVLLDQLDISEPIRDALKAFCRVVEDLPAYLAQSQETVFKLAIYFLPQPDGSYLHYDEIRARIESDPRFDQVCGGCHNMEITRAGASKGKALLWLADYLGIPHSETMACGDTENDIAMLKAAAVGVATANAEPDAKAAANYITASNEEDGVAKAIYHFLQKPET